ncbi:hypothetical protein KTS45_07345 [Halomicroarcula limicola]|uniref:Uncharacterized protein n=1 Tax=Haloarcula limicola TaxID=1429915 RepID=A0A8J7Y4F2_9EURY|nr:hypothetical protein [Halomicroarcula limicola]MBV0924017.1 hypothetical protein [Halomicroarcula limicola]
MTPNVTGIGPVVVYLAILGFVGIQYHRGKVTTRRLPLLVGMSLIWLASGLFQLATNGTTLGYAFDGLSVLALVGGLYGLYWWWRHRDVETPGPDRDERQSL